MSQNKTEDQIGKFSKCLWRKGFSVLVSVCKKSKKIQKETSNQDDQNGKKYKIFKNADKNIILLQIQKLVFNFLNRRNVEDINAYSLLDIIEDEEIPLKKYNSILKKVLESKVK